jgi:predicted transposase YbfD/YdcC
MKDYISEEEKKRQIEQMWEDYERANKAQLSKLEQGGDFKNEIADYFDEEEEVSTNDPVRYEKLSEGKNYRQKFKKKNGHNSHKKSDNFRD